MPFVPSRTLLLVAMPGAPFVASLFLVAMPGAPSSVLVPSSKATPFVASLFLVAMPGAPSSVLVTTSKALVTRSDALVPNSFLLLVVRPGAPSSVLAPSSDARSPVRSVRSLQFSETLPTWPRARGCASRPTSRAPGAIFADTPRSGRSSWRGSGSSFLSTSH